MNVELEIIEKNKEKTDKEQIKVLKMALSISTEKFIKRTKEWDILRNKLKNKDKSIPWKR